MYCKKCGQKIDDDASFCFACGAATNSKARASTKKKMPLGARILCILIVLVTMILCIGILVNDDDADSVQSVAQTTDAAKQSESEIAGPDLSDMVLVDNDTIKATFVGTEEASSLGVFYVTLKIENKTDSEVVVNLEDADVDGETIPLITTGVPLAIQSGNSGQTGFIFSMVNLSISTMDEAEEATFRIVIRDNGTYDTIYESELISIKLH